MDYSDVTEVVIIGACETEKRVIISVVNDAIPEDIESFNVTLDRTESLLPPVRLGITEAVVQIVEKGKHPYTWC